MRLSYNGIGLTRLFDFVLMDYWVSILLLYVSERLFLRVDFRINFLPPSSFCSSSNSKTSAIQLKSLEWLDGNSMILSYA